MYAAPSLPFLYDAEAAKIPQANLKLVADGAEYQPV
jgi:hypothetical protein